MNGILTLPPAGIVGLDTLAGSLGLSETHGRYENACDVLLLSDTGAHYGLVELLRRIAQPRPNEVALRLTPYEFHLLMQMLEFTTQYRDGRAVFHPEHTKQLFEKIGEQCKR